MQFSKNVPIYRQIADSIKENILKGSWKERDRIPSVRELAVSFEVNPNTAMRSYEMLQNQSIIMNKRGIGYFVAEGAYETVLAYKREEFRHEVVPEFFRQMELLKISFEELQQMLKTQQENNNNHEEK